MIESDDPIGRLGAGDASADPGCRQRGTGADGLLQETATIGTPTGCCV